MKVRMVVEIPRDCKIKYEMDHKRHQLVVDRVLKLKYPFNYGFMPETLWDDGDPLDAILVGDFSLHPMAEVEAEPVALVKMYDQGESDFKLICRLDTSDDLQYYRKMVEAFLESYKDGVEIEEITTSRREIIAAVQKAKDAYAKQHNP